METPSSKEVQPPELPVVDQTNPYLAPQPPMPQQQYVSVTVDANGLTEDDKTMGMLVHLLGLLTGFVGVLIIWLIKKDSSKFVDYHGREALNFIISLFIYTVALVILSIVIGVLTMGIGAIIMVPFIAIIGIGQIVCEIMACVAASKGKWHRYPLTIRFIPSPR